MIYKFCMATDTGRIRKNNEDSALFDATVGLAILADGMGGYNAGEVASGMATAQIGAELGRWLADAAGRASAADIRHAMTRCVDNVNHAILEAANSHAGYAGMGTTLVLAIFHGGHLLLGHIGDSRCYRLRRGELTQLTRDHSLLQEQIDAGLLTRQQAASSVNKNLVTRALGVDNAVLLELGECEVEEGDVYLLCSDGLSDMVDDATLAALLAQRGPLEQQAQGLIRVANDRGGRDNVTVLLVQAEGAQPRRGLVARLLGQ